MNELPATDEYIAWLRKETDNLRARAEALENALAAILGLCPVRNGMLDCHEIARQALLGGENESVHNLRIQRALGYSGKYSVPKL